MRNDNGFYTRSRSFFPRFFTDERGSILPFVALTFPVIIGLAGLGTDASLWMSERRNLQAAADAAVVAAGWELAQESEGYMDFAAFKEAENNGYDSSANGELLLQVLEETEDGVTLGITLTQDAETFFSKMVFKDSIRVSAYAEAFVSGVEGQFCVLALEDDDAGAITNFGSVQVNAPTCGLAVNSSNEDALTLSGNVDVTVDTVRVTGNYDVGGSSRFVYESIKTGRSPLADPYDDLEVPDYTGCDERNSRVNSSTTLSPGVYCGGLNISGNITVNFEPGVYIIDGGTFKVTGGGALYGEGVTFILTGEGSNYAQVDISGSKRVEFSSPLEGEEWAGITFFQDRNAPQGDHYQNKILGTSDIFINGVAYFPSQGLWFGGNTTVLAGQDPCTRLIARTVTLAGNPALGNNCEGYGVEDIGTPSVRLIR